MFIIIDNTKNLSKAYMTPLLISYFENLSIQYKIISDNQDIDDIIENKNIKGFILSGCPICLSKQDLDENDKNIKILKNFLNIPILGICFGCQIMTKYYGGNIKSMKEEVNNISRCTTVNHNSIFFKENIKSAIIYRSHNDYIDTVPKGFIITSIDKSDNVIQSIENKKLKRFGVQFHPEGLKHTDFIIKNFIKYCYSFDKK